MIWFAFNDNGWVNESGDFLKFQEVIPKDAMEGGLNVDFGSLTTKDVADIALQRTAHLMRLPRIGSPSYRVWLRGSRSILMLESWFRRTAILEGAFLDAESQCNLIKNYLGGRKIEKVIDIGCGHAFFDLSLWRTYQCDIHLVDIETTAETHHEYNETGAGYASLEAALKFLCENGVPAEQLRATNPQLEKLQDSNVDLIISLISAGFHYPISTYASFALEALKPGGCLIFDARKNSEQEDMLSGFSKIEILDDQLKHQKMAATK